MAAAPPPPPAWPEQEVPAAPAWDPDQDKPVPPRAAIAVSHNTPSGNLEAGYVPPNRHRGYCDDCTECLSSCVDSVRHIDIDGKWLCRGYIVLLFILSILLSIVCVLAGIYANTYKSALAAVLSLSLVGTAFLWTLQSFTFCNSDFDDEAGTWCYTSAYSYWMFIIVALATTHTIVVVTAPNSLRNYHILDTGKVFNGSIRDPEAYRGSYQFYYFNDAMFYPGSTYAPNIGNTVPAPLNYGWDYSCGEDVSKSFCGTPIVPLDFNLGEPIRVFAGCSSGCGDYYTCAELMRGENGRRRDCFEQWGATEYGQPLFGYKHLRPYQDQFKIAAGHLGFEIAPDAIYIRLTSQEHLNDKKKRYKRYGVLVEGLVFGLLYGVSAIILIIVFICIARD